MPLTYEVSKDGVTYGAPQVVNSGYTDLGGGTYGFDLVDEVAKKIRVSITLTGGTSGLVRIYSVSAEAYSLEDQLNQTAGRTFVTQKASHPYGSLLINAPYKVVTDSGNFSGSEIKANGAITKSYDDAEQTNISSFILDGKEYITFEPAQITVSGFNVVQVDKNGAEKVITELPCNNEYKRKLVKFKNDYGVWEYMFFYQKSDEKAETSDQIYSEFSDGYKHSDGDLQYKISLFRDDLMAIGQNYSVLKQLDKNQNIWYSDWQITAYSEVFSYVTSPVATLEPDQRLIEFSLTKAQYDELRNRFSVGDKITLLDDFVQLQMFGELAEFNDNGAYTVRILFTAYPGNDDLSTLDNWELSQFPVYIAAYDAWQLCTFGNMTKYEDGKERIFVNLELKTNPVTNYRI